MPRELESARPWSCFDRRFLAVVFPLGLAFVVVSWLMKRTAPGSGARVVLAALDGALIAGLILFTVAAVRHLDELGQRIQLQAIAIAFAVSGALFSAYGMLTRAGLPPIDLGLWAWPVMAVLWAVATWVLQRRYR